MSINVIPLVSVIMPIYNAEKYIVRSIESVLSQTYNNVELILVNDGSQDNSGVICDEYAEKDRRVRVMHQKNSGAANARNTGIESACGVYLLFVDADDYVGPEYIANLLPIADEDLVYGGYCRMKDGVCCEEVRYTPAGISKAEWKRDFLTFWSQNPLYAVWRGCYKTSIVKQNHLRFRNDFQTAEDVMFNLHYLEFCESIRISEKLDYYYEDGNAPSLIHKYNDMRLVAEIEICKQIERLAEKEEPRLRWSGWHTVLQHLFIHKARKDCSSHIIRKRIQECFNEGYFRCSIPYIRKNGSLDEKIETYFMHPHLYMMFRPVYGVVVWLGKAKKTIMTIKSRF